MNMSLNENLYSNLLGRSCYFHQFWVLVTSLQGNVELERKINNQILGVESEGLATHVDTLYGLTRYSLKCWIKRSLSITRNIFLFTQTLHEWLSDVTRRSECYWCWLSYSLRARPFASYRAQIFPLRSNNWTRFLLKSAMFLVLPLTAVLHGLSNSSCPFPSDPNEWIALY